MRSSNSLLPTAGPLIKMWRRVLSMSFYILLRSLVLKSFKALAPLSGHAFDTGRETTAFPTLATRGILNGAKSFNCSNFLRHQSVGVIVGSFPPGHFLPLSGNSFFHLTRSYFRTCHSSKSCFLSLSVSKYCWAKSFPFVLPYSENPGSSLSGTCWIEYTICRKECKGRKSILNALFQRTDILSQGISEKLLIYVRESKLRLSKSAIKRKITLELIDRNFCLQGHQVIKTLLKCWLNVCKRKLSLFECTAQSVEDREYVIHDCDHTNEFSIMHLT